MSKKLIVTYRSPDICPKCGQKTLKNIGDKNRSIFNKDFDTFKIYQMTCTSCNEDFFLEWDVENKTFHAVKLKNSIDKFMEIWKKGASD